MYGKSKNSKLLEKLECLNNDIDYIKELLENSNNSKVLELLEDLKTNIKVEFNDY